VKGVRIVVTHTTHQHTFYPVPADQGWRVDPASRCIVIGRGVPRIMVPLDGVLWFDIERDGDES
jgi:hypothetical protein